MKKILLLISLLPLFCLGQATKNYNLNYDSVKIYKNLILPFYPTGYLYIDSHGHLSSVNFVAGTNITLDKAGSIVTISATDLTTTAFVGVLTNGTANGTTDDHVAIQASLDALVSGHTLFGIQGSTYKITSGLTIPAGVILDLNGAKLHYTGTNGTAITLGAGASIQNGTIYGDYANTTAITTNAGATAIRVSGNNASIQNMNIRNFSAYGIIIGDADSPRIENNTLTDIGYTGLFAQPSTRSVKGGIVFGNTIDRSGLDASWIHEACQEIRGNGAFTSNGWQIVNNHYIMPINPTQAAAECTEIGRNSNNNIIGRNISEGGTIGLSIVSCTGANVSDNQCINNSQMGIEAGANNCVFSDNIITGGGANGGITIDGNATGNVFNGNKIASAGLCLNITTGCNYNTFNGGSITPASGQRGVSVSGCTGLTFSGCVFHGNNAATIALILDNCSGIVVSGCNMYNFTSRGIVITGNTVVDHYLLQFMAVNCVTPYGTSFSVGGSLGTHISLTQVN